MTKQLIKKLSDAHGIPGGEGSVQEIIRAEISQHVDEIRTDAMGNLIAIRQGGPLKVMLAAHTDEIGLMVKYIDDGGFLRFVTFGGWYAPTLYNQRVVVHGKKKPLFGVVGGKPPHAMSDEERKKEVKVEDMFIDIGASSRKEAEKLGVEVGSEVSVDRECVELAGTRITGKAFDDRVGVALLIRVLQEARTEHTLIGVFTVQEEVGTKGAKTSAYLLEPDCAVAMDVTFPGDHPGIEKKDSSLELGKGPSITISDANGRGLIAKKKMVEWLRAAAVKAKIPVQLNVGKGGTTDATAIHLERGGIPSTVLEIPVRYIHSPVEVMDLQDFEDGVRLMIAALKGAPDL